MKSIDIKIKTKALQIRLSDKDIAMVNILRQKHYVNISQFVRESLRKLYEGKEK